MSEATRISITPQRYRDEELKVVFLDTGWIIFRDRRVHYIVKAALPCDPNDQREIPAEWIDTISTSAADHFLIEVGWKKIRVSALICKTAEIAP